MVVILVATGAVVALRPWEWFSNGRGAVRFFSQAYFWLKGTEDNGPLENVTINLPDPNVENEGVTGFFKDGYGTLSALTDNGIVIEVQVPTVLQLVPPRTAVPSMDIGHASSVAGPKFVFKEVDLLYPGEILEIRIWWEIPTDMADRLTLRDAGLPGESALIPTYALVYPTPAKNIDAQIFAGLYRLNSDNTVQSVVEEFGITVENGQTGAWWALGPWALMQGGS